MQEFERFLEALQELAAAAVELVTTFWETFSAILKAIPIDTIKSVAAYELAKKEHGEWVHRANHSKKKRIRKKYHDKIMRQYWRG